jgi:hypothetical protein
MFKACFINILMLLLLMAATADSCYCIMLLGAVPASFCWLLFANAGCCLQLLAVEGGATADNCYWLFLAAGCCC